MYVLLIHSAVACRVQSCFRSALSFSANCFASAGVALATGAGVAFAAGAAVVCATAAGAASDKAARAARNRDCEVGERVMGADTMGSALPSHPRSHGARAPRALAGMTRPRIPTQCENRAPPRPCAVAVRGAANRDGRTLPS